jgi:hypothetical protein
MTDLTLNINVNKAQAMLGIVSNATSVDRHLLLDDEGFASLLHKHCHDSNMNDAIDVLLEYVHHNY